MQKNTQMQFTELHLNASLLKAIAEERFQTPTLVQEQAIPPILAKKKRNCICTDGYWKNSRFCLANSSIIIGQTRY